MTFYLPALLLVLGLGTQGEAVQAHWHSDYDSARRAAGESGKPILVVFR